MESKKLVVETSEAVAAASTLLRFLRTIPKHSAEAEKFLAGLDARQIEIWELREALQKLQD